MIVLCFDIYAVFYSRMLSCIPASYPLVYVFMEPIGEAMLEVQSSPFHRL